MTAAVCSAGPSLALTWPVLPKYDEIWAVNSALKRVSSDWFAAGDTPMFRGLVGENRPVKGVLTMPDTINACKDKYGWVNVPRWKPWDSLEMLEAQNARRPLAWSVQAALLHAGERHKEIHLYGVDLCGVQDVAGYRGEERTDDRWARERKDLLSTLAVLSEHGVTVKRITWTDET